MGETYDFELYSVFLYIIISMRIIYILIASIVNLHRGTLDARFIRLGEFKKYLKTINEIIAFAFIIYSFNPFNKTPIITRQIGKVSLFLAAFIGIANVRWNLLLNLVGIHIPFFEEER